MGIFFASGIHKKSIYVGIGLIVAALSSCLKNDDSHNETIPGTLVSIVHASPDAGPLLVGINGSRINNQNFTFGSRIIYQLLYPNAYQFQVNSTTENKVLDVRNWSLEPGMCYTIFVTDRLDSLKLFGVRDFHYGDKPQEGFARVRFINLCPDSLSLDLQADGVDTLLATSKKFKQNSAFGEIPADEKAYTLHIFDHENNSRVLSTITFTPKEGKYYTVMAKGLMNTEVEDQKFGALVLSHD